MQTDTTSSDRAAEMREFGRTVKQRPMMTELHRRAEARLRKLKKGPHSKNGDADATMDSHRQLHELQVHQIELEMQNAELQEVREQTETLLEKYTDLYDFAPVGYFSLDASGTVRQVNLNGARLVGKERSRLLGQSFRLMVAAELRPAFHDFLKQVFAGPARQSGDFELLCPGHPPRIVNIEAQRSDGGRECRVVVMDITERKRVEAALGASEERLRLSQDVAHIGTFDWDIETGVNLWTPKLEAMYGLAPGKFAKTQPAWERLVHPDDRAGALAKVDQTMRTGETVEGEWRVLWPDGSVHWLAGRFRAFKDKAGKAVRLAGVNIDITERKRAEDKLRVSEVRYRRLFEAAHDGVLLLDPATRKITDANPFMTKLLDYPHAELVGKELFEIGLLKDEVASQEMFSKLKREHQVRYENLPLESQRGRHQEVEVVANLYRENGHAVIQCNIRDITERKLAEDALRRSEALFSALIEQAPVGVYVVDDQLCLRQVNPKARPVFSKIHPLEGRNLSEIMRILWPRKIADEVMKCFRRTLKTGRPYHSPEFSERRRDTGMRQCYEWQIQRITLPAGDHGVVCFFSDITERKRAEATQRRVEVLAASNRKLEREIVRRRAVEVALKKSERHQRKLLEQSNHQQEQLRRLSRLILTAQEEERREISRELHDVIAQTLTGINVRLAGLKKEASLDTKGLDRNIALTQRLVEKSVDIVHQFARQLRPTVLDDLGLIPALHSFMKSFTTRTGVRTRLSAFAAVETLENSKRTVLYRVAQEALTNVARHAHASRVDVSIQKLPGGVCMKIKDDGKSFDAKRVLRTTGKGRLGLLGMRERVEMVGGKFTVESAPGQGTVIIADLPPGKNRTQGGGGAGGLR